MPEWPEVALYHQLLQQLVGKTLMGVSGRYPVPLPDPAPVVTAVQKKGKFLWWTFDCGACLACELMLGGRWSLEKPPKTDAVFVFTELELYYQDKDWMKLSKLVWDTDGSWVRQKLQKLGPDLGEEWSFSKDVLPKVSRRKKSSVGSVLLDQSLISGIGNYIKCEALFLARIHPDTAWGSLTQEQQEQVFQLAVYVARESLQKKGSAEYGGSFRTQVYKRDSVDGHPVVKQKTKDGRLSFFCPTLQLKSCSSQRDTLHSSAAAAQ